MANIGPIRAMLQPESLGRAKALKSDVNFGGKTEMRMWPFITRRVYTLHGKRMVWLSRVHRKGLALRHELLHPENVPFWKTESYNRSIGISFAVGAALFSLASVLMFFSIAHPHLSNITNITFFLGSIPFTIAASLQHLQSANSSVTANPQEAEALPEKIQLIGWQPRSAGWWSTFSQWVGTIAFNISTFNQIAAPQEKLLDTIEIWAPNLEGSVLFLISGYLAYIEVSDKYWSWRPKDLSWQIVFINLLGCVAFMISAVSPSAIRPASMEWFLTYANTYTLVGAICFFIGAVLTVKESKAAPVGN